MDDVYAINLAKTEIREGYNTADPDRLLAVADEGLIDFSDHRQTGYSQGGKAAPDTVLRWRDLYFRRSDRDLGVHSAVLVFTTRVSSEIRRWIPQDSLLRKCLGR